MEDLQIIELYWNRDESAIAESQCKYGAFCERIARNILGDPRDSEECVADTWHRSWESMPPARPEFLRAFFGRIVRNISISRYRRDHAQKRMIPMEQLLGELEECIPAAEGIEGELALTQLTDAINRWLRSCGKRDRALFLRRYWNGESLKSLAEESGMSANALAQRMHRLRTGLKTALEKEGISI